MVLLVDEMEKLYNLVNNSRRVAITGGPGSGKSWLVDQFINKLENDNFKVIRYNCYQSLQDSKSLDRIRITSLYGNLVSQIIEKYPELSKYKKTIFGANKEELENLLRYINDDLYLIVDGLDHISREYEINKEFITLSETKIISELLNIQFPNNCYVIISSQMIEEINEFKNSNYSLFKIEPWEIKQVENFMGTFQISNNDTIDGYGLKISEYLLKKSQGNPLYLNYILRQLRNLKIYKDLIDKIPDYDLDLSKYYSYLINKINNSRSVYALCGANFYLSIDELKEITGDGEFVSQDVLTLYPLLVENELNGGISIYHESFRRYILSLLQENFRITDPDGKNYNTNHYSLEMIIAVGFKVNDQRAIQFRKWANTIVKDYTIKGWVIDDERLKNGGSRLTTEYFNRLLEQIREIRLSERRFYQKITDIYATSLDYDRTSKTTKQFFAKVQNKMHYAVHGHTAAELIYEKADVN